MIWNRSPGEVRWIIKMHQNGISVREIARISRIPKSTVSRIIARAKTPGCPVFGKKRGRKSKLKSWMRASLTKYIKHNRSAILKDLQYMVKQKWGISISLTQLSAWRRESGFRGVRGTRKPVFTKIHAKKRLEWALEKQFQSWENVFFVDEKTFKLATQRRLLWKRPGERMPSFRSFKFPPSIKVFAGISIKGKSEIAFMPAHVNARRYVEILEENLIPIADKLYPDGKWLLVQDKDSTHTAKLTKYSLDEYGINVLEIPACSPDLNPIEKIWSVMDARISMLNPKNIEELKTYIKLVWQNLEQATIVNTIKSLKNVIPQIISSNGDFADRELSRRYKRVVGI